ncbi:MAG: ribonuclease III [Planctomycetes bacterium]|nr:ribonuclease III [Planctomycetota bacterium]MCC7396616.1 ribonuclease III [Planctomycetota bacterium]
MAAEDAQRDARRRSLRALAKELGHAFDDLDLLDRALTHASMGNEGKKSYERLEFLGDAFLNFAVADVLFRADTEVAEGQLTETRARIVSRPPLAEAARRLDLQTHLVSGKGLRESERGSARILADLVEAVLGAILIDGGVTAARAFVRRHVLPKDDLTTPATAEKDSKTALLHHCQHHKLGQPRYELVDTIGLQHEQEFVVRAKLADGRSETGTARTKRAAEKLAAAKLLAALRGQ